MRIPDNSHMSYFARWSGLSPSGVRYLEGKGAFSSTREDGSGYRQYSFAAFREASQFRSMRAMNLPISQSIELLGTGPEECARALEGQRQAEMDAHERRMRGFDLVLARMGEAALAELDIAETLEAVDVPVMHCLPVPEIRYHDVDLEPSEVKAIMALDCAWAAAMPPVTFGMMLHDLSRAPRHERCAVVSDLDLRAMPWVDIPLNDGHVYRRGGGRGVRTYLRTDDRAIDGLGYDEVIATARRKLGLRVCLEGGVARVMHMRVDAESGEQEAWVQVWLPEKGRC